MSERPLTSRRALRIDWRNVPPAWLDPVEFGSGHIAECLDVIFERLFGLVGQLRECVERNLTCDFKADQGLDVSLLLFSDAGRYRSGRLTKQRKPYSFLSRPNFRSTEARPLWRERQRFASRGISGCHPLLDRGSARREGWADTAVRRASAATEGARCDCG
jgi:hypothetical protein